MLANPTAMSVVAIFFWALLIAAFVVESWAFIHALLQPKATFIAAGKLTKPKWLLILGIAFVIGIGGAVGALGLLSLLPIAAFAAAAFYLVDVKPAIKLVRPGQRQGPYGPW
jgi:hypothetical protein